MQYTVKKTIEALLSDDSYIIPIYQRNFAWEYNEVWQLLYDIHENLNHEYYIGTLVVSERMEHGKTIYEVIDGQQRLTALNIIYSVLTKSKKAKYALNLRFESREKSNTALRVLRSNGTLEDSYDESLRNIQSAIKTTNEFIERYNIGTNIDSFIKKFLNVCIFRVCLHRQTDKNHYFEVMNNRGEQLEAHEILKSQFMDHLDTEEERETFSVIWDGCSDMNKRLEKNDKIKKLWGDDYKTDPLTYCGDFVQLKQLLITDTSDKNGDNTVFSIKNIQGYKAREVNKKEEFVDEEYNSVIDFPNFLLQVLKLKYKENVKLDASKYLLEEFGCVAKGANQLPDAKAFIVNLLRLRILFDKYIIKRRKSAKTNRGWRWVIEQPKKEHDKLFFVNTFGGSDSDSDEENIDKSADIESTSKHLCMIQSMFFVTFRRDVYMHWMTEALKSVENDNTGANLLTDMERFSIDYIWESRDSDGVEPNEYAKGTGTHRYVFNFLDYQLWKLYYRNRHDADYSDYPEIGKMIEATKKSFLYFVFTRRNSVEHYLAQEKAISFGIDENVVNNFGNLSLINASENSRLNNRDCKEKKDYHDRDLPLCQPSSLKYELMFTADAVNWGKETIEEQGKWFFDLLNDTSMRNGEKYFVPNVHFSDTKNHDE